MDARPAAVESGQDLIVGADGLLRRETGLEQAAVAGAPIARSLAPAGYRPDIDGLRAIAVVAVVLCHYQIGPFTGGFVGVDVFFVISGFLITSLIYKETREGRFSIVEFYERRIRRIFPALFFMLALVTAVAFAILLPQDLRTYGASLVATTLFASNVKFFQEVNYFDVAAELKPLLHTWSLAVEEQYYLAFPPLLLLLRKRPASQIIAVVAALAVASLALAAWLTSHDRPAAFYLPQARAWELFLGAALALARLPPPPPRLASGLGLLGLALIGWSVSRYTDLTPFPGLAAVLPCAGAALLIHAGSGARGLTTRILAAPPVVFVGKISYSLYLWHWPLLVFARYYSFGPFDLAAKAALIAASVVLAILSWRYVERPFRLRPSPIGGGTLFALAGVASALIIALGLAAVVSRGAPWRFSAYALQPLAITTEDKAGHCPRGQPPALAAANLCELGHDPAARPSFLLWGDSYATALSPAVEAVADSEGRTGYFTEHNSCPPLMGVVPTDTPACRAFNDAALRVALSPDVKEVILVSRWALFAEGHPYGRAANRQVTLSGILRAGPRTGDSHALFAEGLEATVRRLRAAGKKVILVHGDPEIGRMAPASLAKARILGVHVELGPTRAAYLARQAFVFSTVANLAAKYGLTVVRPDAVLCSTTCEVEVGHRPIYYDDNHLNRLGALQLAPLLRAAM